MCLRKSDFARCEADAKAVDKKSDALVMCQRDLDAAAGREQILVEDGVRKDAELSQRDARITALLKRPTWPDMVLAALVGVAGASCVEVARGSVTARPVCAVSASASALVALVRIEW